MTVTYRLLNYSDNDLKLLYDILDHYLIYQSKLKNPIRNFDRCEYLVKFLKTKFTEDYPKLIYIGAKIEDNNIIDLVVGTKLHAIHQKYLCKRPEWLLSLIYSRYINFSNPNYKIHNTGITVVRQMEKDNFYTFWQCMKFPKYHTNEQYANYISNVYEKTTIMDRYINILEYVLTEDMNINSIPFLFYKNFFNGSTQHRNMCICSHHLKNEYRTYNLDQK